MKYFFITAGAALSSLAIFSVQLGLDNDSGWGPKRVALLLAGITGLVIGGAIHFFGNTAASAAQKFNAFIEARSNRTSRVIAASFVSCAVVISAYFWFIELDERIVGSDFEYYVEMAKSFKNGDLHLELAPPPELLALENPYDYFLRRDKGVDNFPWDLSLYKDKFYIYWGPTPAAIASLLSRNLLNRIGDYHLALAAACALFMYQILIIATYWNRELKHTPAWLLGILLVTVGLITPVSIMLDGAKVYDAAIFSCQLFLIGGCFWAYSAFLDESPTGWKLALAAAHWALSVGSRVIVLPGVAICAGLTLVFVYRYYKGKNIRMFAPAFLGVAIPLLIGGGMLAWYNWARFDSIFEFGLTYQLANIDYTNFTNVFNISRLPLNAGLYLAHPLSVSSRFPFIARIEYVNSNERLAGLIFIAPYVFLLAFPLMRWVGGVLDNNSRASEQSFAGSWLSISLLGASLSSIAIIFSYYYPAMRFVEDFMPALAIFIAVQTGSQYDSLQNQVLPRRLFVGLVFLLAVAPILANVLLAVPDEGVRFAVNFLNDIYKLLGLK